MLFEANPNSHHRLKGEWLHPPAARILQEAGVCFDTEARATRGFVLYPEDDSEPIPLAYPEGSHGLVCPHETLVSTLREAAGNEPNIDFILRRVRPMPDGSVKYTQNGVEESVTADRIVGADGRGSTVLRLLGLTSKPMVCSRMIGIRMDGSKLPMEDYGHIFCGAPGPVFMYRLGEDSVGAIADIPHEYSGHRATELLLNSYVPRLPADVRPLFAEAVTGGHAKFAGNTTRPRISYGNSRFVVIGDAAGHYHPMTAVGLTLSFGDAITLAECEDFSDFVDRRFRAIRAPEMLAIGFYEVFTDQRAEAAALRHAVYRIWRKGGQHAERSMRLLACEDTSEASLGFTGAVAVGMAVGRTIPRSIRPSAWRRAGSTVCHLAFRIGWFLRAVRQLRKSRARGQVQNQRVYDHLAHAFPTSSPPEERPSGAPD